MQIYINQIISIKKYQIPKQTKTPHLKCGVYIKTNIISYYAHLQFAVSKPLLQSSLLAPTQPLYKS